MSYSNVERNTTLYTCVRLVALLKQFRCCKQKVSVNAIWTIRCVRITLHAAEVGSDSCGWLSPVSIKNWLNSSSVAIKHAGKLLAFIPSITVEESLHHNLTRSNSLHSIALIRSIESNLQIEKKVYVSNSCFLRKFCHNRAVLTKTLSGLLLTLEANVATFTHDQNLIEQERSLQCWSHPLFPNWLSERSQCETRKTQVNLVTRLALFHPTCSRSVTHKRIKRRNGPGVHVMWYKAVSEWFRVSEIVTKDSNDKQLGASTDGSITKWVAHNSCTWMSLPFFTV